MKDDLPPRILGQKYPFDFRSIPRNYSRGSMQLLIDLQRPRSLKRPGIQGTSWSKYFSKFSKRYGSPEMVILDRCRSLHCSLVHGEYVPELCKQAVSSYLVLDRVEWSRKCSHVKSWDYLGIPMESFPISSTVWHGESLSCEFVII